MALADAKKTEEALQAVGLSAGGAAAGVIAICRELVEAGTIPPEAASRVCAAMLADINQVPGAPYIAKRNIIAAIQRGFDAIEPQATE